MSAITSSSKTRARTWRVPRLPLQDWIFNTLCGWGVMLLAVVLVGNGIDHWRWIAGLLGQDVNDIAVTSSLWGMMSGVTIWFVGFVTGYYLHYYVPAFIANGRTRRDSAVEAAIFGGVLVAVTTVLVTVGFVYERVVYAIAGWQRGTTGDSLYQSYDDYGRILLATIAGLLMWAAGGAVVGSSFYRGNERGLLSIAIAFAAVSLVGGASGMAGPFAFVARQFDVEHNLLVSAVAALIATGVLAAITWWNVRKLPLRNT